MGYDVSYHPINESEIKQWYFDAKKRTRGRLVGRTKAFKRVRHRGFLRAKIHRYPKGRA